MKIGMGWRLLYCIDTAQKKREGYVNVMGNVTFISLLVICAKCVMNRCVTMQVALLQICNMSVGSMYDRLSMQRKV